MPFGRKKSTAEGLRQDAIGEFMDIVKVLKVGGRVKLDSHQILTFTNFLASLDYNSDYSLAELRSIEKAVWGIPRELLVISNDMMMSGDSERIMEIVKRAKMQITHLKLRHLLD